MICVGWQGPGYYRFLEPAGSMMPEMAPGEYRCGTAVPGKKNPETPCRYIIARVNESIYFSSSNEYLFISPTKFESDRF